jgi:hypothetical protein
MEQPHGADRRDVLLIKQRLPVQAGIGGFEQAPGRGACVDDRRIAGHTRDGDGAVTGRSDEAEGQ